MLSRVLLVIGVAIWGVLVLPVAMQLADSVGDWLIAVALGVVAPVLLIWQINRVIAHAELARRARAEAQAADSGAKERELLRALDEHGPLTPTTAALRTSLTIDEAVAILGRLAKHGHLQTVEREGSPAYALVDWAPAAIATPAGPLALSAGSTRPAPEPGNGAPGPAPEPLAEPLSKRELDVLMLLASGRSNQEIASELVLSVGTVKSHTNGIYRKLAVRNRTEAITRARALAII